MSVLKKLASDTALYGISTIVGRFAYFLLVPLHTYIFNKPALLADNNELFIYATTLNILFTYGMETTFFRYGTKLETRQFYYNTILTALISTSLFFSGLFIVFSEPIINSLNYPGKQRLIVWMAIIIATDAIAALPFARLRMENKAKKFVKIRLTNIGLNIFFNLFFIGFCRGVEAGEFLPAAKPFVNLIYKPEWGPDYIIFANLLANIYLLWALRKEFSGFKFTFDWATFKPLWQYGFPILVMGLAGNLNQTADRLMFRRFLPEGFYESLTTEDAFSIYANCYKLAILMAIVTQAFRYAADPFFFSKAEDKNAPSVFAQVMKWFVIAGSFLWVGISLQLPILGYLISEPYREGLVVVPMLLFANLLVGIYWNLSVWFKLSDKTSYGTRITFIGMFFSVILNALLIPKLGYMGSAISFTISSGIMVVICYFWGQKYFPIPYQLGSAFFYLALAAIFILGIQYISVSSYPVNLAIRFGFTCLFLSIIYFKEIRFRKKITKI